MAKPKYNDIDTRHHHAKQVETIQNLDYNYDYYLNIRRNRRQRERLIFKFSCKVYKYIKKEIWDSIPLRIREDICHEWESGFVNYGELYKNFYNPGMLRYNKDFYKDEFDTWLFRQIKRKTDKSTYRDILINNLLK